MRRHTGGAAPPARSVPVMATILAFSAAKSSRSTAANSARAGAEIVIFPGVRFERMSDAPSPAAKPAVRERDRLSIPD